MGDSELEALGRPVSCPAGKPPGSCKGVTTPPGGRSRSPGARGPPSRHRGGAPGAGETSGSLLQPRSSPKNGALEGSHRPGRAGGAPSPPTASESSRAAPALPGAPAPTGPAGWMHLSVLLPDPLAPPGGGADLQRSPGSLRGSHPGVGHLRGVVTSRGRQQSARNDGSTPRRLGRDGEPPTTAEEPRDTGVPAERPGPGLARQTPRGTTTLPGPARTAHQRFLSRPGDAKATTSYSPRGWARARPLPDRELPSGPRPAMPVSLHPPHVGRQTGSLHKGQAESVSPAPSLSPADKGHSARHIPVTGSKFVCLL